MDQSTSRHRRMIVSTLIVVAAVSGATTSCDTARAPTATGLTPRQRIHHDASPYWPDEPAGFAVVADYGFDDTIPAGTGVELGSSRWYVNYNTSGNVSRVTSQSDAPVSPPNAAQWMFPLGFSGDGNGVLSYDDTVASKEVFLELTFKTTSPFEDSGHPRELLEIWGNSVEYAIALETTSGGGHRLDVTRSAGALVPNKTSSDATLATWHTAELYIKYSSTDSATDGIVRWWLDGTLQGEYTGETMASDGGMYESRVEARWDGGFAKSLQDQVWYDQIHVSRAPALSAAWPNAPGSPYTVYRDEAFNAIPASGWVDVDTTGLMTITQDATAPLSPPSVLQFSYPVGFVGAKAPDTYATDWSAPTPRRVYGGFWWKANANWQDNSANVNKMAFFQLDSSMGGVFIDCYGVYPNGPYHVEAALEIPTTDSRDRLVPTGDGAHQDGNGNWQVLHPLAMGQWNQIEWQIEMGTPGMANGIIRWWANGILVGEYRDITFPAVGITEFQFSPTFGGAADTKTQQDYFWFDHVFLASAP